MTQSERREYLIEYLLKEERKIFRQKCRLTKRDRRISCVHL